MLALKKTFTTFYSLAWLIRRAQQVFICKCISNLNHKSLKHILVLLQSTLKVRKKSDQWTMQIMTDDIFHKTTLEGDNYEVNFALFGPFQPQNCVKTKPEIVQTP